MTRCRPNYETDDEHFNAPAYTVRGYRGIAFYVLGWELEPVGVILCPDCDYHAIEREHGGGKVLDCGSKECEHTGAYYCDESEHERTGKVIAVMVGDDVYHVLEESDLTPLDRSAYCGVCGQIGCHHDGLDRSEDAQ